jgi:peptide/nickel transport system permease protein
MSSAQKVDPLIGIEFTPHEPRPTRGHWGWIARRIGLGLLVLFAASLLTFFAVYALPGDPAQAILGKDATPENVAQLREALNLDQPMLQQYVDWVSGLLRGDFGTSLVTQRPVSESLEPALWNSLSLLLMTAVIALPLSLVLGVATARRRGGAFDQTTLVASVILTAMPEFVIGMLLVAFLATGTLHVLPAVAVIPEGSSALQHPVDMALPVFTLVLAVAPYLYRLVRGTMIDVLESEYVVMANLKGLSPRKVTYRHALPNALVPATQAAATIMSYLLGGIVVVEFIFGFPGIGTLLTTAVTQRDIPVIEAVTMVITLGVVVFNLAADVITVLLTPKLRTGGAR